MIERPKKTHHDPEAHLVSKIIQARITRLMARANSVDVVSLHEKQILLHELVRNSPSMDRMMFVPVGTLDDNALSIDFDQTVL